MAQRFRWQLWFTAVRPNADGERAKRRSRPKARSTGQRLREILRLTRMRCIGLGFFVDTRVQRPGRASRKGSPEHVDGSVHRIGNRLEWGSDTIHEGSQLTGRQTRQILDGRDVRVIGVVPIRGAGIGRGDRKFACLLRRSIPRSG